MPAKSLLILICCLVCYFPPSILVLRYFRVEHKLYERALIFGVSVGGLMLLPPVLLLFYDARYGANVGVWVGVGLAYLYLGRVLKLSLLEKIAIIAGLPVVAGLLSLPLIFLVNGVYE